MSSSRSSLVCCSVHSKLLDHILCILALRHKYGIFHLFDLQTKE
ncbi:hypothetical protein L195_g064050, partial [Trifolium pratense]